MAYTTITVPVIVLKKLWVWMMWWRIVGSPVLHGLKNLEKQFCSVKLSTSNTSCTGLPKVSCAWYLFFFLMETLPNLLPATSMVAVLLNFCCENNEICNHQLHTCTLFFFTHVHSSSSSSLKAFVYVLMCCRLNMWRIVLVPLITLTLT